MNNWLKPTKSCLSYAFVTTVVLSLLPFAVNGSTQFLGKDVSTIAAGIVSFYPEIAISEVVKILSFVFFVFCLAGLSGYLAASKVRRRSLRALIFPGAMVAAFFLFHLASVLEYPALFESHLSLLMRRWLVALAGLANPQAIRVMSFLILITPAILLSRTALVPVSLLILGLYYPIITDFRVDLAAMKPVRPHVVFIVIDSLRFDRLEREDVLPNIRTLASDIDAVSFADHQVGIPRTFPSWVEILEGRQSTKNGIRHMFPGFGVRSEERRGLPSALRGIGYNTVAISDFAGDIFPRIKLGFERIKTPKLDLETLIRMSVDQSFPGFLSLFASPVGLKLFDSLKESPLFADPKHLTDEVIRELRNLKDSKPLFLTVFYSTAHFPYASPYPYYQKFASPGYEGKYLFQKNPELSGDTVSEEDVLQVRRLYDGALRSVDDQLARIFETLKHAGLWDDSLIVITADHGEDLYENGMMQGHGEHLRGENVLHVPLIFKLPYRSQGPKTVRYLSRAVDIAPTVASIVGASTWEGDGFDFAPWLSGKQGHDPGLTAYAETGIWFSRGGTGFYQSNRLDYPGISGMLSFDQGYTGEIVLNPLFEEIVVAAKHRALITTTHKLIYIPGAHGVQYELYDRSRGSAALKNISEDDPKRTIDMTNQLIRRINDLEKPNRQVNDGYLVRQ